jgi:aerobic-type carbon monoxide dehydrogenase small subunit (CoxS/CutS family)
MVMVDEKLEEESSEVVDAVVNTKLSRRTFLKAGAASAAVLGLSTVAIKSQAATGASQNATTTTTDPFASVPITLNVNGKNYSTTVEPRDMLVNVLREHLLLTGTKRPCNRMECGGCTVVIDGQAFMSCTYIALRAQGKQILTVEATDPVLQALQTAWVPNDASQCGYCQPGRLMSATALLKNNPNPTEGDILTGIEGNLCRCGTYLNVLAAVQQAAKGL